MSRKSSSIPSLALDQIMAHLASTFDKDTENYVELLLAKKLDAVLLEPGKLEEEEASIQNELSSLMYQNYTEIVAVSDRNSLIEGSLCSIYDNLSLLTDQCDRIQMESDIFTEIVQELLLLKESSHRITSHSDSISELLQAPSLMDELVRNGYYEDAIDLLNVLEKLVTRYSDILILETIRNSIKPISIRMQHQLVHLLRSDSKLPLLIRVIGYLRKLGAFSDMDLRIIFLNQRNSFLLSLLSSILFTTSVDYLKRYIELCREHIFDIITQFKAIFGESSSTGSQEDLSSLFTSSLLTSFTLYWESSFMNTLNENLLKINDISHLATIYTQCMYYGMSLGRVGLDFRLTMVSAFESNILSIFQKKLSNYTKQFIHISNERGIEAFRAPLNSIDDMVEYTSLGSTQVINPPSSLIQFGYFAVYHNQLYTLFNQLRQLALLSVATQLAEILMCELTLVSGVLAGIKEKLGIRGSQDRLEQIIDTYESCFIPSVCKGFEAGIFLEVITAQKRKLVSMERILLPLNEKKE